MNNSIRTPWGRLGLGIAAVAALTACVAAPPQYYQTTTYPYQPQPAYQAAPYPAAAPYAAYGRVVNIEVVQTQGPSGQTNGTGAVIGGLAGGVLGNQIGHGSGRALATVAGVLGGAVLGNTIESRNYSAPAVSQTYRLSVQTDDGGYRAFDVPSPGDLRVGDRVRIDGNGQISRADARG